MKKKEKIMMKNKKKKTEERKKNKKKKEKKKKLKQDAAESPDSWLWFDLEKAGVMGLGMRGWGIPIRDAGIGVGWGEFWGGCDEKLIWMARF